MKHPIIITSSGEITTREKHSYLPEWVTASSNFHAGAMTFSGFMPTRSIAIKTIPDNSGITKCPI